MRLRLFLAASALALLSGCAGLTSHEALEGQGDAQTWKTHKQQLSELDAWQIDGKVGIRAPRDSGSARATTTSACPARSAAAQHA